MHKELDALEDVVCIFFFFPFRCVIYIYILGNKTFHFNNHHDGSCNRKAFLLRLEDKVLLDWRFVECTV